MMLTVPWKDGHVHVTMDSTGEVYRGQVGARYREFNTMRKAKLWVNARSRSVHVDLKALKPAHNDKYPKLDFYAVDGTYLYSSTWYESIAHAWAHVNPKGRPAIGRIARAIKEGRS